MKEDKEYGTGRKSIEKDAETTKDGKENSDDLSAKEKEERVNYLNKRINLFKPATPFMRDHLRLIGTTFIIWMLLVFGPILSVYITATNPAGEGPLTEITLLGFQLHYFLTAVVTPAGVLILALFYSWRRDKLDEKYEISHGEVNAND